MNRSRLPIVLLLIVSLLCVGLTRHWAAAERRSGSNGLSTTSSGAGLSRMNSYALALLLGGLRGPLVMFLWPSSEEQKNQRNLEDFDTKIEWIRLLQAEFDTVHIFQMWNKAYNISVQKTNIANKYSTILDALDYGQKVAAERPNNINILYQIGDLYFSKLGTSNEKNYYRQRVREDSMARVPQVRVTLPVDRKQELVNAALDTGLGGAWLRFSPEQEGGLVSVTLPKSVADVVEKKITGPKVTYVPRVQIQRDRNDQGWRRTELDPMLDADGNLLPQYLVPTNTRPASLPPDSAWNDGSELQYLKQFEPFPYGISTLALGYNYFKQSQVLQTVFKQKHAQNSELVVDVRPAHALRNWSEEEWERGRRAELEALGKDIPAEPTEMEPLTALVPLDAPIAHPARISEALYSYDMAAKLVDLSIAEYQRHLSHDKTNLTLYISHMADMTAEQALLRADAAYLRAMTQADQRSEQVRIASEQYKRAIRLYELILMQYYTPDAIAEQALPPNVTRATIPTEEKNWSDQQVHSIYMRVFAQMPAILQDNDDVDTINQYLQRIGRAQSRLSNLPQ